MANENDRVYKDGDLVVYWKPARCVHCHACADSLPLVFDEHRRPWVKLQNGDPERIKQVVNDCPSQAISLTDTE